MPEELPPHIPLQPILDNHPSASPVGQALSPTAPASPVNQTISPALPEVPPHPDHQKPITLLRWIAPSRLHDPKSPTWFLGLFAIGVVGIILFAVLREVMLILLTAAFIFVYYALARVEPAEVEHRILNIGVDSAGRIYSWKDLKSYWIMTNGGVRTLRLDTAMIFPPTLELLLPEESELSSRQIEQVLNPHIPAIEKPKAEAGAMADSAIYSVANLVPKKDMIQGWLTKKLKLQ